MITGERIIIMAGAVVVVLLQVFLGPHIALGNAFPCFPVAFCLSVALVRYEFSGPVMAFVLGLVFDLASGGPVGAMALALTITTAFGAWFHERAKNDTLFMSLLILALCVFLANLIYGLVFMMFGYSTGLIDAFVNHILPCFVYDFVLAIIFYLVASRLFSGDTVSRTEIKQL